MAALAHTRPDHDETLIARLAAGDLDDRETAEAIALVTACPACAQLQVDLRAIMVATAGLPAPRRTRDFRLTDADAASLRRTGWRRLVGRFGDPRLAFTRPLAGGLVTLGIAGLVLAVGPSFLPSLGSAGGAAAQAPLAGVFGPAESSQGTTPNAAASNSVGPLSGGAGAVDAPSIRPFQSAAPVIVAGSAAPATSAPSAAGPASSAPASSRPLASTAADLGLGSFSGPSPAAPVLEENPGVGKSTGNAQSPGGPSPVVVVSLALLVVGSGLFLLRWAARRTA